MTDWQPANGQHQYVIVVDLGTIRNPAPRTYQGNKYAVAEVIRNYHERIDGLIIDTKDGLIIDTELDLLPCPPRIMLIGPRNRLYRVQWDVWNSKGFAVTLFHKNEIIPDAIVEF